MLSENCLKRIKVKAEIFKTLRDFNNKFPSKFYICSNCGKVIPDSNDCMYCGWRADGLFKTMERGYQFVIVEQSPEIQEIFKPIEMENINNAASDK